MPVEIRTCDGRHSARRAHQLHQPLPLVRLVGPRERQRRQFAFALSLILFSAGLIGLATLLKGF
jgi:hypothetical protein